MLKDGQTKANVLSLHKYTPHKVSGSTCRTRGRRRYKALDEKLVSANEKDSHVVSYSQQQQLNSEDGLNKVANCITTTGVSGDADYGIIIMMFDGAAADRFVAAIVAAATVLAVVRPEKDALPSFLRRQ